MNHYLKLLKALQISKDTKYIQGLIHFKLNLIVVLILLALSFLIGLNFDNLNFQNGIKKTSINQSQTIEDIKININESHLTNTIRLSQKASNAPEGKKFLVIFTEAENASSSAKQLPYGNWFRLEEAGSPRGEAGKKLAPLPLNSTFAIPPQATLEKQIVFIVDSTKTNFKLLVGNLEKDHKSIDISIK